MASPELSRSAEENLRTIRSLMERATIYRAISAGPALVAGLLALGLGIVLGTRPAGVTRELFLLSWLGALTVVGGVNTAMLRREARSRGGAFPSAASLHGMKALLPPMAACGAAGLVLCWTGDPVRGVLLWAIGYGLGLLATASFAPRSIRALGWAFLSAGVAWFLWHGLRGALAEDPVREAAKIMAATFGGFHLVYAVRTGWWKRRSD